MSWNLATTISCAGGQVRANRIKSQKTRGRFATATSLRNEIVSSALSINLGLETLKNQSSEER